MRPGRLIPPGVSLESTGRGSTYSLRDTERVSPSDTHGPSKLFGSSRLPRDESWNLGSGVSTEPTSKGRLHGDFGRQPSALLQAVSRSGRLQCQGLTFSLQQLGFYSFVGHRAGDS